MDSDAHIRIRIRIHKVAEYGSNDDPDPQHGCSIKDDIQWVDQSMGRQKENITLKARTSNVDKLYFFIATYQCCGSGSVLDPYSGALWIRIHTRKYRQ